MGGARINPHGDENGDGVEEAVSTQDGAGSVGFRNSAYRYIG